MKPKIIILINPPGLYERFCQACLERDIHIITLYTVVLEHAYFQLNPKYSILTKQLARNIAEDIKAIKAWIEGYELLAVIPAMENDLAYSEQIAHLLFPQQTNDPQDAYLRFNKFEMNEALKRAGLNYIPQVRLSFGESIDSNIPLNFPVVVKPSFQSGGSVGVKICDNFSQVQAHLESLRAVKDSFGKKLESDIVIQEKIEGTEYFADSVTWQGKHYITSIYKYEKALIAGLPIYRYGDYVNPQHELWKISHDYIQKVLDVLHVNYNFGHTEFMVTADRQLYLMELNPRLSGLGGTFNSILKLMGRQDASDVYLNLLEAKQSSAEESHAEFKPENQHGRLVCLFSWKEMTFKGFNSAILEKLESAQHKLRLFKSEEEQLSPPKDLLDIVAVVTLVDKDLKKIIADTEYLQQLESKGVLFND